MSRARSKRIETPPSAAYFVRGSLARALVLCFALTGCHSLPLGALAGGWLGAFLGVPAAIAIGGFFSGCSALWLLPLREREVPVPTAPANAYARLRPW